MAVPRTIPNWVQAVMKGTYAGDNWVFTHNYACNQSSPPSVTDMNALAQLFYNQVINHMKGIANLGVTFTQAVLTSRYPGVANTQGIFNAPAGTIGSVSGTQVPGSLTGSLTKYDGFVGRKNRNRSFFLPIVEELIVNNQSWASAEINAVTLLTIDLLTSLSTGAIILNPSVASFAGQFLKFITRITVWTFLRNLRLRIADERRTRHHRTP